MINIYKQIRAFYSIVFEGKFEFRPTHISLYMFLLNQNNRSNWTEWFKCPFDTVMLGACINSNKTYYNVLKDLQTFKLIKYQKGINNYKAPKIHIVKLDYENDFDIPKPENSSVIFTKVNTLLTTLASTQLSKQQSAQLDTQLSAQLSTHKDILITNNFKLVIVEKKEKTYTAATEILGLINSLPKEKIDSMIELTLYKGNFEELKKKFAVEFIGRYGLNKKESEVLETLQSWMSRDKQFNKEEKTDNKLDISKLK